jgi:hypothetical protein
MVVNKENYWIYSELVDNGHMTIDTKDITSENYSKHFNSIMNILRDGIEDPKVQSFKIHVSLADGNKITFVISNYWMNLVFWTFPVYLNIPITVEYLFDSRAITKKYIKSYFNKLIRKVTLDDTDFIALNNVIDETIYKLKYIDEFSLYLANTLNFKDTIDLMKQFPEFNKAMHTDLTGVPVEDVKNEGMKYAETQIRYITSTDHCLRDSFVSGEAINKKQYKEVASSIGTKPNGQGGVFPYIINNSFMNGGVSDPESYVIDSSVGRIAQILQKMNVGISGSFARLLETNNIDTFFNENPNYSCDTENFIIIPIKDATWLRLYDRRYYRFKPTGPEYLLDATKDNHLIGKTLYFRSPITCASHARGTGICRKCYGELFNVNKDINPGKYSAEILSSKYTQMLLSAKHLLESNVIEMIWSDGFFDIFEVNFNTIKLQEEIDFSNMYLKIDLNTIDSDDDDDDDSGIEYDEYITNFDIQYSDGTVINMHTAEDDNIYISEDLNKIIKSKNKKIITDDDGIVSIPLTILQDTSVIFSVKIQNKELQRTLDRAKHIINRSKDTNMYDKDTIVREFVGTNIEGDVNIQAVHLEIIIANQMRDPDDIMSLPNWSVPNAPYNILTLNSSLTNSPSITATLEFQKIAKTLVNPLSYKKRKPSVFDMYFMEKPQDFAVNKDMISDRYSLEEDNDGEDNLRDAIYFDD